MTTLNQVNLGKTLGIPATLENRMIHDFNNGGLVSTYGLNTRQRVIALKVFLGGNAPKCYCVNCL
jgi:hypothetical protein